MNRFQKELARQLVKIDCTVEYDNKTGQMKNFNEGTELCTVHQNRDISYDPKKQYTDEQRELYFAVQNLCDKTDEYLTAFENAPALQIKDLRDGFRRLAEYNNVILAVRDVNEYGFEFVTWEKTYGGTGVMQGHYMTDFDAAKQDFAVRSGLVPKQKLFENEQLENIYRCLYFTRNNHDCLTYDQEKDIDKLMDKIETILPYVKAAPESGMEQDEDIGMTM